VLSLRIIEVLYPWIMTDVVFRRIIRVVPRPSHSRLIEIGNREEWLLLIVGWVRVGIEIGIEAGVGTGIKVGIEVEIRIEIGMGVVCPGFVRLHLLVLRA
jgi:hypothetical protein